MTINKEQILPIVLSIVVVLPAIFVGGLVDNLVSRAFYVGFWGDRFITLTPAMLAAAVISYRWPDKFWRIAPVMTLTMMAPLIAESWGERKSAFWDVGFYYNSFLIVPYFLASVVGYWFRMWADSRSERESKRDALRRS